MEPGTPTADALADEYRRVTADWSDAYEERSRAQDAEREAATQRAVDALERSRADAETRYSDLFRQLYVDRMKRLRNLDQRLASAGITGGAAESAVLGWDTSYEEALRQGELERGSALDAIDKAIADTRLTGDIAAGIAINNKGTVERCAFYGDVTVEKNNILYSYVGGIVARNDGAIVDCAHVGNVKGAVTYVGGVVGANYALDTISHYATGVNITEPIRNCYHFGGSVSGGQYNGSTDDIVENHAQFSWIKIHAAPSREGYKFLYWKGSEYHPGDKYTVTGDHSFTAVWEKEEEKKEADTESKKAVVTDKKKYDGNVKTGDGTETGLMMLMMLMKIQTSVLPLVHKRL